MKKKFLVSKEESFFFTREDLLKPQWTLRKIKIKHEKNIFTTEILLIIKCILWFWLTTQQKSSSHALRPTIKLKVVSWSKVWSEVWYEAERIRNNKTERWLGIKYRFRETTKNTVQCEVDFVVQSNTMEV